MFLLFQIASAQNLIQNGDFAKNGCPEKWCISTDANAIAPWTYSGSAGYEISNKEVFGLDYISMDLNAHGEGDVKVVLTQNVPTEIGGTYEVSFETIANNRGSCGEGDKPGYIAVDGSTVSDFSATATRQTVKYSFAAMYDNSKVSFGSKAEGRCGPVIFNIRMIKTADAPTTSGGYGGGYTESTASVPTTDAGYGGYTPTESVAPIPATTCTSHSTESSAPIPLLLFLLMVDTVDTHQRNLLHLFLPLHKPLY
jgi:hypothetical protein